MPRDASRWHSLAALRFFIVVLQSHCILVLECESLSIKSNDALGRNRFDSRHGLSNAIGGKIKIRADLSNLELDRDGSQSTHNVPFRQRKIKSKRHRCKEDIEWHHLHHGPIHAPKEEYTNLLPKKPRDISFVSTATATVVAICVTFFGPMESSQASPIDTMFGSWDGPKVTKVEVASNSIFPNIKSFGLDFRERFREKTTTQVATTSSISSSITSSINDALPTSSATSPAQEQITPTTQQSTSGNEKQAKISTTGKEATSKAGSKQSSSKISETPKIEDSPPSSDLQKKNEKTKISPETTQTQQAQSQPQKQTQPADASKPQPIKGELKAIDVNKITEENTIDIELICKDEDSPSTVIGLPNEPAIVKIDRNTFEKVKISQPPILKWLPPPVQSFLQPLQPKLQSIQVLKSIPNDQLFLASVIAGSLTEMIRTTVLYPLATMKARVQARTLRSTNRNRPLLRKLRVTWLTFVYETKRGDWYAGLWPTLLISIPASGVYSGVKDVSKRLFSMVFQFQFASFLFSGDIATSSYYNAIVVNLLAAFVADVASLAVRTPADVLALRLQVFGSTNVKSDLSEWAKDSVALLPPMILTDVPYLLSRIFLNAAITTSGENLGRYEVETIGIACLCAFLTTPFDVARTRILLPTLPLSSDDEEEKSGMFGRRRLVASSKYREERRKKLSVLYTLKRISAEGNGGVQNLFAGWIERTAYLGIGRAWLDPLRVIGYLGIRDALLLKLFD